LQVAAKKLSYPLTAAELFEDKGRIFRLPRDSEGPQTQIKPSHHLPLGHHMENSCGAGTQIIRV